MARSLFEQIQENQMFAKLYETSIGQILVKMDENGEERPEVRIFFQPEGLGVCSVAVTFSGDAEGSERQKAYFKAQDQQTAVMVVEKMLLGIKGE